MQTKANFQNDIRENIDAAMDNNYTWFLEQTPKTLWEDMKDCTNISKHSKFCDQLGLKTCEDYLK